MLKGIRQYFQQNIKSVGGGQVGKTPERALQLAAASLLMEVSRADFHVSSEERNLITKAMQDMFNLSANETDELVELAEQEMDNATCLYEFARLVNDYFDYEEKLKVIYMMWRVAFVDLNKDKYEEHIIRRVSDLLHVSHKDFVRLRHDVQSNPA